MDRRTFIAACACLAATPALARFPTFQSWKYRLGPMDVPFVVRGQPEDLQAFSSAMREALYDLATKDVPQVLKGSSRDSYQIYVGRLGRLANAILAARTVGAVDASALVAAIPDRTRRTAYATVAATAILVRWRAAAVAATLEPLSGNLADDRRIPFPLLYETEGGAFGAALVARSRGPVDAASTPAAPRSIAPWQLAIVERQMRETFARLADTPLEDHARAIELAYGYGDTLTRGPSRRPDGQEAAAIRYAEALFANASTPLWKALTA